MTFKTVPSIEEAATELCKLLQTTGAEALFVGGYVRDNALGFSPTSDIDIATSLKIKEVDPILLAKGWECLICGESFEVIRAKKYGYEFEVASFRKDVACDGRRPTRIEYADSLTEDAMRRDFTINALYFNPTTGAIIDVVGGKADLLTNTLRFVGNPEDRIQEDYLRILRFVRFWAKGYRPDEKSLEAVKKLSPQIMSFVAPERIMIELRDKIASKGLGKAFFDILYSHVPELLEALLPEVYRLKTIPQNPVYHPEGSVGEHTRKIISFLDSTNLNLLLAGLLHDTGKYECTTEDDTGIHSRGHEKVSGEIARKVLERYRFSTSDTEHVVWLVENHMKLHFPGMSKATFRRLAASPYFLDLIAHAKADCLASNGDTSVLEHYIQRRADLGPVLSLPPPIITGKHLISRGIKPGPIFRDILGRIMDAQLEGEIETTEQGLSLMDTILKEVLV